MGRDMEIRAAVFDLDGLMIDSERVVMYAWNVAGNRLGYGDLGENLYHTLGMSRKSREAYFREKYGKDFPFEVFSRENRQAFMDYAARHGIPARKGLHEILEILRELKLPLAVATSSSREYALGQLGEHRILGYFREIVTGDMVEKAKPSPEIYQKACELLACPPGKAVALEDSVNGILAAHYAGMLPVLIPDLAQDLRDVEGILAGKFADLGEAGRWIAGQAGCGGAL